MGKLLGEIFAGFVSQAKEREKEVNNPGVESNLILPEEKRIIQ